MNDRKNILAALLFYTTQFIGVAQKPVTPAHSADTSKKIAIINAQVISMRNDRLLNDRTVYVVNGVIERVRVNRRVPKGYHVMDAHGKYLLPGLSDMHIHLRSLDELNSFMRHGVTTVLHMGGAIKTAPDLLKYRDDIRAGELIGPNLYVTSKLVEGEILNFPSVSASIVSTKHADEFIEDAILKKYDFIKMYETIDSSMFYYFMEKAARHGISVVGHTPRFVNATQVLKSGHRMVAHGEEFFFDFFDCRECGVSKKPDETKIPELISILKKKKIFVTPNLSFINATALAMQDPLQFQLDPEFKFLNQEIVQTWRSSDPRRRREFETFMEREKVKYPFVQKLTKEFNAHRIPLLSGTDCSLIGLFPGKSLWKELYEMQKAGLSNYECLLTATANPGRFIFQWAQTGTTEKFGMIKKGYRADLLFLDKNPLEELANIETITGIMLRGKYLTTQELDARRKVYNLKF